jgi:hypothetical protein
VALAITPNCSRLSPAPTGEGGDDRRALEYYKRAMALGPGDPDVIEAYEAAVRAYGSSIVVEGFGEGGVSDARVPFADRIRPRRPAPGDRRPRARAEPERIVGDARRRRRDLANQSLDEPGHSRRGRRRQHLAAERDLMAEVRHYRGAFELGGIVRYLSFSDVGCHHGITAAGVGHG